MTTQRIVRSRRQDRLEGSVRRQYWLAEGRDALRELERSGGVLSDLDDAHQANPQAFNRLVVALRELGAEVDASIGALARQPSAGGLVIPLIPLIRRT